MKQETKELIKWCISLFEDYRVLNITGKRNFRAAMPNKEIDNCESSIKFLKSLPEIESHLCRGGYIQDVNGTPCCDGDKVIVVTQSFVGVLRWDVHDKKFVVIDDTDFPWTLGSWDIEKVEKRNYSLLVFDEKKTELHKLYEKALRGEE